MGGAFDLGSVVAHITADNSGFQTAIEEAKAEASSFGDNLSNMINNVRSFAEQAAVVVGVEGAAFEIAAKYSIDAASGFEQSRIALDAFTGSAQKGGKAMQILNQFSKEAPLLPIQDVMQAGTQILAFGFKLDDLKDKIREVGELSVATHTPMTVAIDLFARAKEGIFNLREYGQFGITREELEKFGVSFDKAGSAVNKAELLPALEKLINSRFGSLFQKESTTFAGAVQNTKDDIARLAGAILGVDAATGLVAKGSLFDKLEQGANAIFKFLEAHMGMIKQIGGNKTVQMAIEGFVLALASLIIIIPIVIAVLNPIVLIVIAIEAVIVALYIAWNTNFLGIRDITRNVINEVMNFFNNYLTPLIKEFMVFWHAVWPSISAALKQNWDIMIAQMKVGWDIFYGILKIGIDLLTGNWKKAWEDVKAMVQNIWNDVMSILGAGVRSISNWGGQVLDALVKPFNDAWNSISNTVNKIKDALDFTKRHSPSVLDIVQNGVSLVNQALQGINMTPQISTTQIANNILTPMNGLRTSGVYSGITVNLPNAMVSDNATAAAMGEKIGNAIISKLKQNVRF